MDGANIGAEQMKEQLFLNEDCLIGMKRYPDKYFDLAIVDPPYGNNDAIGIVNGNSHNAVRKEYKIFENKAPDNEYFQALKRVSKNQIIWGANFFGLMGGYICWYKHGTCFGEAELAYCSLINSVKVFDFTWNGMIQENMKDKESRIHPTQKPVALYRWLLKTYAKEGMKILDTHVGSASSLIAFEERGMDYVGFEVDKDYFNKAKDRIKKEREQLKLFAPSFV
jgi:site-specific DNA-methyltransferase (adenine-specific)